MTYANWMFVLNGNLDLLKRDIEAYPVPSGVTLTTWVRPEGDPAGQLTVNCQDTELSGKMTMPYPNQLDFLDYLTEREGFKTHQYGFSPRRWFGKLPDPRPWQLEDYLIEKGLA